MLEERSFKPGLVNWNTVEVLSGLNVGDKVVLSVGQDGVVAGAYARVTKMIRLEHIHRYFQVGEQTVHALNDINVTIEKGEYVSVMGPSGSGKSTLLNVIALLDQPSSGRYLLNNQPVTQLRR